MNEGAKETVLRHFTYGLYAVTVKREGDEHGITANWVSQASFDRPWWWWRSRAGRRSSS